MSVVVSSERFAQLRAQREYMRQGKLRIEQEIAAEMAEIDAAVQRRPAWRRPYTKREVLLALGMFTALLGTLGLSVGFLIGLGWLAVTLVRAIHG